MMTIVRVEFNHRVAEILVYPLIKRRAVRQNRGYSLSNNREVG